MQDYEDNLSTLTEPDDYGIKISLPGYDASTAQDIDLAFSSSWPNVQIVQTIEQPDFEDGRYRHGLGYPPLVIGYDVTVNVGVYRYLSVDSEYVYGGFISPETSIVTNVDLSKDIEYPLTGTQSARRGYDQDYGIKVARKGGNVDSKDLRNFTLHSRAQSLMVLAVKTEETINPDNPSNIIQYTSPLDRTSIFICYVKGALGSDTRYIPASMNYAQAYPVSLSNGRRCYVEWLESQGSVGATIVCLRNPFFAPSTEEVLY